MRVDPTNSGLRRPEILDTAPTLIDESQAPCTEGVWIWGKCLRRAAAAAAAAAASSTEVSAGQRTSRIPLRSSRCTIKASTAWRVGDAKGILITRTDRCAEKPLLVANVGLLLRRRNVALGQHGDRRAADEGHWRTRGRFASVPPRVSACPLSDTPQRRVLHNMMELVVVMMMRLAALTVSCVSALVAHGRPAQAPCGAIDPNGRPTVAHGRPADAVRGHRPQQLILLLLLLLLPPLLRNSDVNATSAVCNMVGTTNQ